MRVSSKSCSFFVALADSQLSPDIVERFQLGIMLFIIALRNLIELSSTTSSSLFSILPVSFSLSLTLPSLPSLSLLQTIFSPAIIVLISECFVDWLKHAFITKFNHIRPKVYGRFIDVLCKDLVVGAGRRTSEVRAVFWFPHPPSPMI